ncbi:hypothetical protein CEG14_14890 [Bordetella genomosp. 1]|uniref:Uncharacterized protein n=1 Tax=Bordetella genomosp. 1 TaxID=1395607 RepID=A0A261SFZ2_9BORD|nr:hypothetical protein [Bordetella genomosp. 1]OZI36296.1 hypothetical protein CEG14_14890 [Bordetella genomosp. 1]
MSRLELLAGVVGVLGFAALLVGVAMIYIPAAYIVGGVGLMAWAWRAEWAAQVRIEQAHRPAEGG